MADFGEGIGGVGGIDGMGGISGGGDSSNSLHLHYSAQLFGEATRRGEVQTWEGDQADVLEKFRAVRVGDPAEEIMFLGGADDDWGTPFVGDVRAPRRQGKTWMMQITVVQLRKVVIWTLDFAEISKDIRTWRQEAQPPGAEPDPSIPDLSKIAQWERAKDIQDWDDYDAFKTVDGEKLKDATLELAQMIRKGVESYTIHTPVPTMTMRYYDEITDTGKLLDCYLTSLPNGPEGWTELGGANIQAQLQDLTYNHNTGIPDIGTIPYNWLCVADRAAPNGDGSSTRTIQFMRVDRVEDKLYAQATAADGGLA
jgi:hypothetical protein